MKPHLLHCDPNAAAGAAPRSARSSALPGSIARRSAATSGGKFPRGGHRLGRRHGSNSPTPATGSGGHQDRVGVRTAPRLDRGAGRTRPQRREHLSRTWSRRTALATLQLGETVRGDAQGGARRSGSTCWSSCPARRRRSTTAKARRRCGHERQVQASVLVRDDAQVLGQELPQDGVEDQPGDLGAAARGSLSRLRWLRAVRRARQSEGGGDPARHLRAGLESGVRRDAGAPRRGGRSVSGPRPESQGYRRKRDPAYPEHGAEGAQVRVDRGAERVARALGGALGGAAHPRPQETAGGRDVPRGTAASAAAAGERLSILPPGRAHGRRRRRWCRSTAPTTPRCRRSRTAKSRCASTRTTSRSWMRKAKLLRRHEKAARKGAFALEGADRLFNPSRETARILARVDKIGPHTAALARELFARLGRPGQRAIYGLAHLPRPYAARRHRGGVRAPARRRLPVLRRREARPGAPMPPRSRRHRP